MWRNFSWLVVLVLCSILGPVEAQVSPAEREALIDLYHATGGDDWHNNDGWLWSAGSECRWWHGITCNEEGELTGIRLDSNNLTGNLPEILDRLPALWFLNLEGNRLTGPLPPEYVAPPHPQPRNRWRVNLSHNRLSGALPAAENAFSHQVAINLAHNNLSGPLPASWSALTGLAFIDLSANPLQATFPEAWVAMAELRSLRMANTGLSGPLPSAVATMHALEVLDLSDNRLNGELPDWLSSLSLHRLSLQRNDLEGPIDAAVAAMHNSPTWQFELADNHFSGPIPESLIDWGGLPPVNRRVIGAAPNARLDLCWNDLTVESDAVAVFLEERHSGASVEGCLGRQRTALDLTISGSWYDPEQAGQGFVQMLLENGQMLIYWFKPTSPQFWGFDVASVRQTGFVAGPLALPTGGKFAVQPPDQLHWPLFVDARIQVHRIDNDLQHASYDYNIYSPSVVGMPESITHTARMDQTRLTRLAGTTCDNQHPNQWISGAWYDPERAGEGFIVEVTESGHGVVYWFTYTADGRGRQAWMMGDGEFDGTTLIVDNLIQPVGAIFGAHFDPEGVDPVPWGSLTMEFHDDLAGHIHYDSVFEDYGSGEYPIERLARPMLAECE